MEAKIKEMQSRYDHLIQMQGESIANPGEQSLECFRVLVWQRSERMIRDALAECQKTDCKINSLLARCKLCWLVSSCHARIPVSGLPGC